MQPILLTVDNYRDWEHKSVCVLEVQMGTEGKFA
jgi:hypothetical protein